MEDITDANYMHAEKACKDFEIKNLVEFRDFYVQSNLSLLADLFENFWNTCFEIYEFDPVRFLTASWLEWQAALKKNNAKLNILTDIDML